MNIYKNTLTIDKTLEKIEEYAIFYLLVIMLSVVFVGVLNRFIIHLSLPWSEELARYLMIWAAFIGASLGVKRGIHISIDSVKIIFPKISQKYISLLSNFCCFILCSWILVIGLDFIEKLISTNQLSPAMRISIYYAYASVPIGFLLMLIRYAIKIIYDLKFLQKILTNSKH